MHKYTAEQLQDGSFFLRKDGYAVQCPKVAIALPIQQHSAFANQPPQITMVPQRCTCSTYCPFASIAKHDAVNNKEYSYTIGCESGAVLPLQFYLDEIKFLEEKKEPHIIGGMKAVTD
jgi:hypothetical protein